MFVVALKFVIQVIIWFVASMIAANVLGMVWNNLKALKLAFKR